jgi:hypothetical protein
MGDFLPKGADREETSTSHEDDLPPYNSGSTSDARSVRGSASSPVEQPEIKAEPEGEIEGATELKFGVEPDAGFQAGSKRKVNDREPELDEAGWGDYGPNTNDDDADLPEDTGGEIDYDHGWQGQVEHTGGGSEELETPSKRKRREQQERQRIIQNYDINITAWAQSRRELHDFVYGGKAAIQSIKDDSRDWSSALVCCVDLESFNWKLYGGQEYRVCEVGLCFFDFSTLKSQQPGDRAVNFWPQINNSGVNFWMPENRGPDALPDKYPPKNCLYTNLNPNTVVEVKVAEVKDLVLNRIRQEKSDHERNLRPSVSNSDIPEDSGESSPIIFLFWNKTGDLENLKQQFNLDLTVEFPDCGILDLQLHQVAKKVATYVDKPVCCLSSYLQTFGIEHPRPHNALNDAVATLKGLLAELSLSDRQLWAIFQGFCIAPILQDPAHVFPGREPWEFKGKEGREAVNWNDGAPTQNMGPVW